MELNLFSDALRLALIYKHGGWYADIDTVIMKPLSKLVESHPGGTFYISSDQKNKFLIEVRLFIFFISIYLLCDRRECSLFFQFQL